MWWGDIEAAGEKLKEMVGSGDIGEGPRARKEHTGWSQRQTGRQAESPFHDNYKNEDILVNHPSNHPD